MTIHKEGYVSIGIVLVFGIVAHVLSHHFLGNYPIIQGLIWAVIIFLLIVVLQFFRHPGRNIIQNDKHILSPADGKVVVIEETTETEVLKDRRI